MDLLNHPSMFVFLGLLLGVAIGAYLRKRIVEGHRQNIKDQAKQLIENAIVEAEQLKKEAQLQSKEEAYQVKQAAEDELKADRRELKEERSQLNKKRELLKKEWDSFDRKQSELQNIEEQLRKKSTR